MGEINDMSASLRAVPRQTAGLAKVIHQINKLEKVERDVIALLPSLTDDEVIDTRTTARLLYCSAWKIEIACDAEIWDRAQRSTGGRGNTDKEEKGIMAAVNKRAAELGCGASTIRKNAQLYRRFETVLSGEQSILDDKGFFQAALTADDPDAAIETFAKKKLDNPHYRVADAYRDIEQEKEQAEQVREGVTAAIRAMQMRALADHIEQEGIPATEALMLKCPNAKFAASFWSDQLQQLRERLVDMRNNEFRSLLVITWHRGKQTTDAMVEHTGLPKTDVTRIMRALEDEGYFVEKHLEWKTEQGRGTTGKVWRRTEKKLPAHLTVPEQMKEGS